MWSLSEHETTVTGQCCFALTKIYENDIMNNYNDDGTALIGSGLRIILLNIA